MDDYLTKPIDQPSLYAVVEQSAAARVERPPASFDRAAVLERLGGDEQLVQDVIRLFLEDAPARLAAIKAAVHQRDAERIRRTAHALKGAAGNLSSALSEAAQVLERIGAEQRLDAADAAWRRLAGEAAYIMDALRALEPSGGREAEPVAMQPA